MSKQAMEEIQAHLESEDSCRPGALDKAISQILVDVKPHDYGAWKWPFEDTFGVELHTLLKVISVFTTVTPLSLVWGQLPPNLLSSVVSMNKKESCLLISCTLSMVSWEVVSADIKTCLFFFFKPNVAFTFDPLLFWLFLMCLLCFNGFYFL